MYLSVLILCCTTIFVSSESFVNDDVIDKEDIKDLLAAVADLMGSVQTTILVLDGNDISIDNYVKNATELEDVDNEDIRAIAAVIRGVRQDLNEELRKFVKKKQ